MTELKPGVLLKGQYRLDRVIGEGAMGAVYQAHDERNGGGTWALKILNEAALPAGEVAEAVALFRREADISARLRHPGLPEVVDFFSEDGLHVLVMARIQGETLDARMERRGRPMDEQEVVPLLIQLCACLSYLHQRQPHPIVFRDLKPSNCMVTATGQLHLIDFGIARHYKPGRKSDTLVIGTPGFCAPEQYGHGQTEPRSDIYSLGAMAWHLLSGVDPASVGFSFPPLRQVAPRVSAGLEAIVARCVAFAPDDRYPSAIDLAADLRRGAIQPAPPKPRWHPARLDAPFVASWARRTFWVGREPVSAHVVRVLSMLFVITVLAALAHLIYEPPRPPAAPHARYAPRGGEQRASAPPQSGPRGSRRRSAATSPRRTPHVASPSLDESVSGP